MAAFAWEVLKGIHVELSEETGWRKLVRGVEISTVLARELGNLAAISAPVMRSLSVYRRLPPAVPAPAPPSASPYGVHIVKDIRYAANPRNLLDVYVPHTLLHLVRPEAPHPGQATHTNSKNSNSNSKNSNSENSNSKNSNSNSKNSNSENSNSKNANSKNSNSKNSSSKNSSMSPRSHARSSTGPTSTTSPSCEASTAAANHTSAGDGGTAVRSSSHDSNNISSNRNSSNTNNKNSSSSNNRNSSNADSKTSSNKSSCSNSNDGHNNSSHNDNSSSSSSSPPGLSSHNDNSSSSSSPPGLSRRLAPVVLFCHGGIWSTGDKWQFACMAVRLAQAGMVVVLLQYSLYPEAVSEQMAEEVSEGITWTLGNVRQYGGDPGRVTVMGHSAGAHLAAMALLLRARASHEYETLTKSMQDSSPHFPPATFPPVSSQMPACFIGMSGVYDLPLQYEVERMRRVHNVSTLCRANGGVRGLVPNSPAILLASAACEASLSSDAATGGTPSCSATAQIKTGTGSTGVTITRGVAEGKSSMEGSANEGSVLRRGSANEGSVLRRLGIAAEGRTHEKGTSTEKVLRQTMAQVGNKAGVGVGGLQSYFGIFELEGDAIPVRCGLHDPHAVTALRGELTTAEQKWLPLEAARKLPPCVVMSSCTDHMVPWHEGAQLVNALEACGVPARHLIYQKAGHNDFIFNWQPIRQPRHAEPDLVHSTAGLAHFGRDLVRLMCGGPQLLHRRVLALRSRL